MVAIRIGEISVQSLDDDVFRAVLAVAADAGGATAFPLLFALQDTDAEADAPGLLDELARLSALGDGPAFAMLLGHLRDDLMEAVSVASEG
jgi:hypothetical protein